MSPPHEERDGLLVERPPGLARRIVEAWGASDLTVDDEDPEETAAALLGHLTEAVTADRPEPFRDWVAWARTFLEGRGGGDVLDARLRLVREQLADRADQEAAAVDRALRYLDTVRRELDDLPEEAHPPEGEGNPLGDLHLRYLDALMEADREEARRLVFDALDGGADVRDVYLHVFQAAQREMGRRWQRNQVSVAQEHFCTAATQLIMSQLYERIFSSERTGRRVVVTSVAGDLHELGARVVADFFEMEGWDTVYLGANSPAEAVVATLRDQEAHGLAVSATMTTHVPAVAELVDRVRADEATASCWILVGGYPFLRDPDLWRRMGADAMASDALEAVQVAARLEDGTP